MNEISKKHLYARIEDIEEKGTIEEMSEMFREYIGIRDILQEEMYSDFEMRAKEYICMLDEYRTAVVRLNRRYKRLKISYITLAITVILAVMYYLLVEKYGLIDLNFSAISDFFKLLR